MAVRSRSASRTSPMNQRMKGYWSAGNSWAISYCFSSSRLKMISLRGVNSAQTWRVKARPKEPVPPVIRITLSFRSARGARKSRPIRTRSRSRLAEADAGLWVIGRTVRPGATRPTFEGWRLKVNEAWFRAGQFCACGKLFVGHVSPSS